MSWLGRLNYYFLQWLFLRLAKTVEENGEIVAWDILVGVYPKSSWDNKFRWIGGKKRYVNLWRK